MATFKKLMAQNISQKYILRGKKAFLHLVGTRKKKKKEKKKFCKSTVAIFIESYFLLSVIHTNKIGNKITITHMLNASMKFPTYKATYCHI